MAEHGPSKDLPDRIRRNVYTKDREPGLHVAGLRKGIAVFDDLLAIDQPAMEPNAELNERLRERRAKPRSERLQGFDRARRAARTTRRLFRG